MARAAKRKAVGFKPPEVYTGPRAHTDTDYSAHYSRPCCDWGHLKSLLAGALAYAAIATIVHFGGAIADMGYYLMPDYFGVWSPLMMPAAGPPPASFMYASVLFNFIIGLLFAYCYSVVKGSMPGLGALSKGLNYGMFVMMLAGLPFYVTMTLLINLPQGLLLSWLAQTFIIYELAGVAVARVVR